MEYNASHTNAPSLAGIRAARAEEHVSGAGSSKLRVIRVLGSFELSAKSGSAIALPTRKCEAIVAMLALRWDQPLDRSRLQNMLWPDVPRDQGNHSLRQALVGLRRNLDVGIVSSRRSLALAPEHCWVDAVEFERELTIGTRESLMRAVQLYRADLLDGFPRLERSFASFVDHERVRLRGLLLRGLSDLIDMQIAAGELSDAQALSERRIQLDPLSEPAHRTHMRLLLRRGLRSGALAHYRQLTELLRAECQGLPEAETRALGELLQRGDVMDAPASRALPAPSADASSSALDRSEPVLERSEVLEWLLESVSSARASHAHAARMLIGEAGTSKTHTCDQFMEVAAARGVRVLLARCFESERELPHALWRGLLEEVRLDHASPLLSGLPSKARAELARLAPEISESVTPAASSDISLIWALECFLRVLCASGPVALVLEDLHWADPESLRALGFLARRRVVTWIGTARPEECAPAGPLQVMIGELQREAGLPVRELLPLSRAQSFELIAQWGRRLGLPNSDDEAWKERVWTLSQGNARMLREQVQAHGRSPGDPDLPTQLAGRALELVSSRIQRLSATAREVAELAAVQGSEIDLDVLSELLGDPQAWRAVQELVHARLLRVDGHSPAFVHEPLRAAIYAGIVPSRRRQLHSHTARVLSRASASLPTESLARLAYHYANAGLADQAIESLKHAAVRARQSHGMRDALTALDQAGQHCLSLAGPKRHRALVTVTLVRAPCLAFMGRPRELVAELERHAVANTELEANCALSAEYHFWWAFGLIQLGQLRGAEEHAMLALQQAELAGGRRGLGFAHGMLAYLCAMRGRWQEGADHGRRAVDLVAEEDDLPEALVLGPLNALLNHLGLGDWRNAQAYAQLATARAARVGSDQARSLAAVGEALVHLQMECWSSACEAALRAVNTSDLPMPRLFALWTLARAQLLAAEELSAVAALEQFVTELHSAGITHLVSPLMATLADAKLQAGDVSSALSLARQAAALSDEDAVLGVHAHTALARAHAAQGELPSALAQQTLAVEAWTGVRAPVELAAALERLGELEIQRSGRRAAIAAWRRSHALFARHGLDRPAQRVAQRIIGTYQASRKRSPT